MRLAIAQPGAQSVTAMGLIAPVYASGLPWPVRAGAAVGHRAVAFADALHWRARAQPAGEMLAVDCGRASGGFGRRSALRATGAVAQATSQFGQVRPRPRLSTALSIVTLSTAKAVYKSNRGCHHVPRRRHTNLTVAATTCREGGI